MSKKCTLSFGLIFFIHNCLKLAAIGHKVILSKMNRSKTQGVFFFFLRNLNFPNITDQQMYKFFSLSKIKIFFYVIRNPFLLRILSWILTFLDLFSFLIKTDITFQTLFELFYKENLTTYFFIVDVNGPIIDNSPLIVFENPLQYEHDRFSATDVQGMKYSPCGLIL